MLSPVLADPTAVRLEASRPAIIAVSLPKTIGLRGERYRREVADLS